MYDDASASTADLQPGEEERTAFRKAEKVYKLYKTIQSKNSSSRRRQKRDALALKTDLTQVIDFAAILNDFHVCGELPPGIVRFHSPGVTDPIFCFRDKPGFFFIPRALNVEEQCQLLRESLASFPEPPNRTNHTAIYGPLVGLLDAARKNKLLGKFEFDNLQSNSHSFVGEDDRDGQFCKIIAPAVTLLRKLRWSTLGLQFDWSKRSYDISLPHREIPSVLCLLAKKLAVPAMPLGEEFSPEAAIVNYFGPSDMLGGHLDDMEADWSKPIVSISLGCKAIFLLGGKTRDDPPLAMFLRSGDVVLMAGEARQCFHGVPRIFCDDENADCSALVSHLTGEEDIVLREYIQNSRVNINIRQVF
ncbi:oxidoreductase, 2OG-Fe(II) oxygenase family protein [Wolffia australiana]